MRVPPGMVICNEYDETHVTWRNSVGFVLFGGVYFFLPVFTLYFTVISSKILVALISYVINYNILLLDALCDM